MSQANEKTRIPTTGVTLVEMLVVLALFAVVSGAVVMSLPGSQTDQSADISAEALVSDIEHAMSISLARGEGFAIAVENNGVKFLQRDSDASWKAHTAPRLQKVKLFPGIIRLSNQGEGDAAIYAVSSMLVPNQSAPLRVLFGDSGAGTLVIYDGASVRIGSGEGN